MEKTPSLRLIASGLAARPKRDMDEKGILQARMGSGESGCHERERKGRGEHHIAVEVCALVSTTATTPPTSSRPLNEALQEG